MKRIRSLSLFFILTAAFAQTVATSMIYLEYQIRKDFIVSELCKDRYVTINVCGGKCFIVDKFTEQQKRETQSKTDNIRLIDLKVIFVSEKMSKGVSDRSSYENKTGFLQALFTSEYSADFFHPPKS